MTTDEPWSWLPRYFPLASTSSALPTKHPHRFSHSTEACCKPATSPFPRRVVFLDELRADLSQHTTAGSNAASGTRIHEAAEVPAAQRRSPASDQQRPLDCALPPAHIARRSLDHTTSCDLWRPLATF